MVGNLVTGVASGLYNGILFDLKVENQIASGSAIEEGVYYEGNWRV